MEIDKIYNEDCIAGIKERIPNESIDMVITSPPYDDLRKSKYSNSVDYKQLFKQLYRVAKQGGVIVWVVQDQVVNGGLTGTSAREELIAMDEGFLLDDDMIWRKTNPLPQFKAERYSRVWEHMFVFSKGKPKTFNPIMQKNKFAGLDYDSTAKNVDLSRTHKQIVIKDERIADDIWDIAIAQNKTGHPAVCPQQLVEKHLRSWSNAEDLVLDPFMGSGTTALAARKLNRHYLGFELEKKYYDLIERRLSEPYQPLMF